MALAITSLFASCRKDESTIPGTSGTGGDAALTAERYGFDGGTAASSFKATAAGITRTSPAGISQLSITGIRDGGKESVTIIVLKDITGTGKVQFGPGVDNGGIVIRKDYTNVADMNMSYSTDNSGTSMKGGGEVNITSYDGTNIEGTFYAVCYNASGQEAYAEQGAFKGKVH